MEKLKVPGYYDSETNRYFFAGPGKGGKCFMVLYFFRGEANKRHRFNDLPIRFNLEESRADLARHASNRAWKGTFNMVDCVFLDNKRVKESANV